MSHPRYMNSEFLGKKAVMISKNPQGILILIPYKETLHMYTYAHTHTYFF